MKKQTSMILFFTFITLTYQLSTFKETGTIESSSYSLAGFKSDSSYLLNSNNYKKPTYVSKLPPKSAKNNLRKAEQSFADEIHTNLHYYDGSMKLVSNEEITSCDLWTTTKEACSKSDKCGWCAQSAKCIPGDSSQPLTSCSSYQFTLPPKDWNPFPENIEVDITHEQASDGGEITTITPIGIKNDESQVSQETQTDTANGTSNIEASTPNQSGTTSEPTTQTNEQSGTPEASARKMKPLK